MAERREPAGRGRRLAATLVDGLLVPAVTVLLVMVTGVVEDAEDYRTSVWMAEVLVLAVVSYVLLNGITLWRDGQTLGKKLLGIRLVAWDDGYDGPSTDVRLPFWKLVPLRALFFPLLFCLPIPWLCLLPLVDQLAIFRKDRRCVHDLVCGTAVIRAGTNS
ncbi:MAG: RDD family protein [Pseudomonadales bacterium]